LEGNLSSSSSGFAAAMFVFLARTAAARIGLNGRDVATAMGINCHLDQVFERAAKAIEFPNDKNVSCPEILQ
jgi:hypothetical protein